MAPFDIFIIVFYCLVFGGWMVYLILKKYKYKLFFAFGLLNLFQACGGLWLQTLSGTPPFMITMKFLVAGLQFVWVLLGAFLLLRFAADTARQKTEETSDERAVQSVSQ